MLCERTGTLAVNVAAMSAAESALHVLNYGFDREKDTCESRHQLGIAVRTGHPVGTVTVHAPGCPPERVSFLQDGSRSRLTIPRLDIYAVVHLER